MKKTLLIVVCLIAMISTTCFAGETEDYSYLDDMTINQLKKLDEEIHKRLPSSSTNVSTVNVSILNEDKTESNEEEDFDTPVTVLDNEYMKMDFIGKYVEYDKAGQPKKIGYKVIVENKTDTYLNIATTSASIDGFALGSQAGPYSSFRFIPAHNKANGEYYIPLDGREIGLELNSIEDLKDLNAAIQLHLSEDGSSWSSDDSVNVSFDCVVP